MVSAGYSYQLADVFSRSASVGMLLEYGNAWEQRSRMSFSDGILNGSVYLGLDSWLGPLLLGYGMREGGNGAAFLKLGKPFRARASRNGQVRMTQRKPTWLVEVSTGSGCRAAGR